MEADEETGPDRIAAEPDTARLATGLRLAVGRVTRRLRQAHAVGDVTLSGVSVLARLEAEGPGYPGSLADLERVRPQAMAGTLAGLEQRGLVRRTPDAADGRRAVVTITEEGRAMLAERRSESVHRLSAVLEEFTAQERQTLASALPLLDRLAARL
ncbi:MarR family winged helix-turn-helix transcriptional regulator [Streptomyces sp. NPDC093261]|uniref:MarR family winged helix-turn-helix transcriptional regulator n=1 Tax=Streptomyces sp. NPDC093261 TaxID=3366037 RepID=UPI0037F67943